MAIAATAGLTASSATGLAWYRTRPSGPVIRVTRTAPPAAPGGQGGVRAGHLQGGRLAGASTALDTARNALPTPIRAPASTTALAPRSASPPPRRAAAQHRRC